MPEVSLAVAETLMLPFFTMVPAAGEVMVTVGGVVSAFEPLLTLMVRAAAVALLPAASRAIAVMVWLPLLTPVVLKLMEYGAVVSSWPTM